MTLELDEIRRRALRNRARRLQTNEIETQAGTLEMRPFITGVYSTLDVLLRLHDLHNKSIGLNTINDEFPINTTKSSQLYRNLNTSINAQLMVGGREKNREFWDSIVNLVNALGSVGGLESTLMTSLSMMNRYSLELSGIKTLFNVIQQSKSEFGFAAGHSESYFFNNATSSLFSFTRPLFYDNFDLSSFAAFETAVSNQDVSDFNPGSKAHCVNKYAMLGASIGGGIFLFTRPRYVPAGTKAGIKVGEFFGNIFCKPEIPDNDNHGDEKEEVKTPEQKQKDEELEKKRKELGCIADPNEDYLNYDPFISSAILSVTATMPIGSALQVFVEEHEGSHTFTKIPEFDMDFSSYTHNKIENLDLGFMQIFPIMKDQMRYLKSNFQDIKESLNVDGEYFERINQVGKIGKISGEIIDIKNLLSEVQNAIDSDELEEIMEVEKPSGPANEVTYAYTVDSKHVENNVEENYSYYTVTVNSPLLREKLGPSILVEEKQLVATLEDLRLMERIYIKQDAVTNFGDT